MRRIHFIAAVLTAALNFYRPAAASTAQEPLRICLISDQNGPYGSVQLPQSVHAGINQLVNLDCNLVLGAGDLVAGQDLSLSDDRLKAMWSEWKQTIAEPFLNKGIPILSALGNHDASAERNSSGGFVFSRERTAAAATWNALSTHPAQQKLNWLSREQFPFYFSVKFNSTGIIVFDGSSAGEVARNRGWLERQLQILASDKSIRSRLVVGHLPLFAVARGRETAGNVLAPSAELYDLFNRFSIDFYISGHHHAFYPARPQGAAHLYGTVQLALGAMGDGPRRLLSSSAPPPAHSMTLLEIEESIPAAQHFLFDRFRIKALSPFNGALLPWEHLPEWLDSNDGRGQAVRMLRFDL